MGRTLPVPDMCLIFLTEVTNRGQDRVRRCLSQTAQSGILDEPGEFLQEFDVSFPAFPPGDPFQDMEYLFGTFTAWGALTTILYIVES